LSDLAPYLISKRNELASKCPDDLEFFNYDNRTKSLPRGTMLKTVEQDTSDTKPLVVRYPLSDNTSRSFFLAHIVYARAVRLSHFLFLPPVYIVVVNLRFLGSPAKLRLPYTTGVWFMLLTETKEKYERLQEDENEFYFVDQETKKETVDNEFMFNDLLKDTSPNCENKIVINLLVRIKGAVVFLKSLTS
jgi:hypothetical protein